MKRLSIQEVKTILQTIENQDDPFLAQFKNDSRKGVQQLLAKWQKNREQELADWDHYQYMMKYENKARVQGYNMIAGIDEVGRGPLAGPVVSAAVILPANCYIRGLNDSKKLNENKREELYDHIKTQAISIGIGVVDANDIDQINIYEATKKSMQLAILNLNVEPDFLLIDAVKLNSIYPEESIVKGDANSVSIAAASIIAKVTRDRMMKKFHQLYPEYHFDKNMGYGTQIHLDAINKYGPCEIHRKTFAPIKKDI